MLFKNILSSLFCLLSLSVAGQEFNSTFLVEMSVLDYYSEQPLQSSDLTISVNDSLHIHRIKNDSSSFFIQLEVGAKYDIELNSGNYIGILDRFDASQIKPNTTIRKHYYLMPLPDCGPINLPIIEFEFNSLDYQISHSKDLDYLLDFMVRNPEFTFSLSIDRLSKEEKSLPQQRIALIRQYFIEHGIHLDRFTFKYRGVNQSSKEIVLDSIGQPVLPKSTMFIQIIGTTFIEK